MIKALIIDDEELARTGLNIMIRNIGDIDVIGEASDGIEALEKIVQLAPDLIFLDINMPGLNGFEVLAELKHKPAIIFTTAYSEFALNAFKENAIDYLLKPIQSADLVRAVEKVKLQLQGSTISKESLKEILSHLQKPSYKQRFLFEKGTRIIPVEAKDIAVVFLKDKILKAYLFSGQNFVLQETLDKIEAELNPYQFFRISRQALVNASAIKEINVWFKGKLKLELNIAFADDLVISTEKASQFKTWLKV